MDKRTDLRIQRTQKAIIDAFYELLEEKHFSSITIIDICDRALINRGTFYTHFQDKYQLLEKCVYDMMSIFLRARSFNPTSWKKGHIVKFPMADGKNCTNAQLLYQGKQTIKADNGHKYLDLADIS